MAPRKTQARDARGVSVGNVPIRTAFQFTEITNEQAEMVVAIQQGL